MNNHQFIFESQTKSSPLLFSILDFQNHFYTGIYFYLEWRLRLWFLLLPSCNYFSVFVRGFKLVMNNCVISLILEDTIGTTSWIILSFS